MNEHSKNKIINNVKKILLNDENVIFAYIFGSYARGETHRFSDIDIAVFLKEYSIDKEFELLDKLSPAIPIEIDLIILNNAPPLLRHKVLSEGILLFCKDDDVHYKFMSNTLIEALDFKEAYKIIIEGYRERLHAGRKNS
ncbi:MAG: nucleotidyltransferase domain-containing protein [Candidatus Asgardarchaeum californiense]|nr:MAG: nucleotidyltransferase domain-containing protein [Candidatus Asgardarchaeum californiense]